MRQNLKRTDPQPDSDAKIINAWQVAYRHRRSVISDLKRPKQDGCFTFKALRANVKIAPRLDQPINQHLVRFYAEPFSGW